MYLPLSFSKSDYSELEARNAYYLYLGQNERLLKEFGLWFYGYNITESHTETAYTFALDNGKSDLNSEQSDLYFKFLEACSKRYTEIHNNTFIKE